MVNYSSVALAALAASILGQSSDAFVPIQQQQQHSSLTALDAFTPPSMIIGPAIRKMREEGAKKKMPMASPEERSGEAPGLRVGNQAWKWPPVWPYDEDFFKRKDEIAQANPMSGMQGMLTGMPAVPGASPEEVKDEDKLDVIKYWEEEQADVTTDLDPEAVEKLKSHYSFYLRDGMSVLEMGAAEDSYLPDDLKLSRHVGVGASQSLMKQNPSITETLVVDLNKVEEGRVVDNDELRALASTPFDAIIMANTIDFLTSPREVFRTAWELLKPGGICIVPFAAKDAYTDKFEQAQTKMWKDMSNDQHMWICGSFFQFSAGEGWEGLKGFDISPEGAEQMGASPFDKFFNKGKPTNMYVVQATKGIQDEQIDESDPEKSFSSKMWMLPTMEERDKALVVPRLARAYKAARSEHDRELIGEHVDVLPKVYESLIKMDQFAFTFNMQAQLAADLVTDPDFVANDEQIAALKQGLGLRKPSEQFWAPVGEATAGMDAESKVNLLAHVVPRFGSGDPAQEEALESFVSGLKPTFATIRSKLPDLSEADVQLLGTELLAAEILKPGRSTREEFATWLNAMDESEMTEVLAKRKSFKEIAEKELDDFKKERADQEAQLESRRKSMEEQVRKAREERTMAFNPETGKMEPIKK